MRGTLLTPPELKRIRQQIADAEAGDVAMAAGPNHVPGPADAEQCWRILRGKRTLAAEQFLGDRRTRMRLLGIIVGSAPIDKLFGTFFECEQYAKERTAAQPPVGLLESMVDPSGILHRVHRELAQYILDTVSSPFVFISSMSARLEVAAREHCRSLRALQLRFSASIFIRCLLVFWQKLYSFIRILNEEMDGQNAMIRQLLAKPHCPKCLSLFLTRLRARLLEEPRLSMDEMRELVVFIIGSICNDPYVVSMHPVELLHAEARQGLSVSVGKRKKQPHTVFAAQGLRRWRTSHKRALGKHFRTVPNVKATIKKHSKRPVARRTYCGTKRRVCGSNVQFSMGVEQAKADDGPLFAYRATQTRLHAEWAAMPEADRKWYRDRAAQGFLTPKRAERANKNSKAKPECHGNLDAADDRSPWQMGSVCRPCSAPHMVKIIKELLPDGRHWLREGYDRALTIKDPSASSCSVVDASHNFPLTNAAKARLAQRTCFERTPGLCCLTKDFRKIKRFRSALTNVVGRIAKSMQCHGELLWGFGCNRRGGQDVHPMLTSRGLTFVFLSGSPDKRNKWKVFTCCKHGGQVQGDELTFPFPIRLATTPEGTFVEQTDYMLAEELFMQHPDMTSWHVYVLSYHDICSHMNEVLIHDASAGAALLEHSLDIPTDIPTTTAEAEDDFEALLLATCTEASSSKQAVDDGASTESSMEAVQELQPESSGDEQHTDVEEVVEEVAEKVRRKLQAHKKSRSASAHVADAGVSVNSPHFSRAGPFAFWRGARIGKLTTWGQNMSCHCLVHPGCKTPAIGLGKIESDRVFLDWLLSALTPDGSVCMSRNDHVAAGKALRDDAAR